MKYLLVFIFIATVHGYESRRLKRVVRIDKKNDTVDNGASCFHYTWLADEDSLAFQPYLNKSCSEKYAKEKPPPLCVNPMLVTDNGNEPDTTWLLNHKRVTCHLQQGYACVKYTYRFNGKVQNVTRYCTKVTLDDTSMEDGCIVSDSGASQTEVCACTKMLGNVPCNGSAAMGLHLILVGVVISFVINLTA